MADYQVKFEVFEGPLDLLLHLVKKAEVDIYQVNLTQLATQFIEYVELMKELDLDIAGEFLVMAATLMYIKSRELLPRDQQAQADDAEDDTDDPRWELIRKLVEYKKFKDAAARLAEREQAAELTFPRQAPKLEFERPAGRTEVTLFDLVGAVSAILRRVAQKADTRDIFEDKWTVSEKIEHIRRLLAGRPSFRFSDLFGAATSRTEVVVTFLALLELIRLRKARAVQTEVFGEIAIEAALETAADAPALEAAVAADPASPAPDAATPPANPLS
jgi:segregation and condensation protein A